MIALIGDIHGEFATLKHLLKDIPPEALVIQLGDFGYWGQLHDRWEKTGITRTVYFIDGNHDHVPALLDMGSIWPYAKYIPRGTLIKHDGLKLLCVGGSKSVDRKWRTFGSNNHGWFEQEQLSKSEAFTAELAGLEEGVDIMLTHTPPEWVIRKHFPVKDLAYFGINPLEWVDESARRIEQVWKSVGKPQLFCGHMHRSITDEQVRILNINEVVLIESKTPMDPSKGATDGVPVVNS